MRWYSTYLGPQIPIETTGNMQIVWVLGVTYMFFTWFHVSFWDPGRMYIETRIIERNYCKFNIEHAIIEHAIIEQNW